METIIESNKKIARQFFEHFGNGDFKKIENLWGNNYKFHAPGIHQPLDKEGCKKMLQVYVQAFPDLKFSIEDQIAEGDKVVTRIAFGGVHKGAVHGAPATHKKITMSGVATHKIVNGKIEEERVEFDSLGVLKQIGGLTPH